MKVSGILFLFFFLLSSCMVSKTYRLDGKLEPYSTRENDKPDLKWIRFDSLLINSYMKDNWLTKSSYSGSRNILVVRTTKRNLHKFERFFCEYWASEKEDNDFIVSKFDFCNCCLMQSK